MKEIIQKKHPELRNGSNKFNGKTKASPGAATELKELFEDELKEIYGVEKAMIKTYPLLIQNTTSAELSGALKTHLLKTEQQVIRAEEIFSFIALNPEPKKCEAITGLIKEAEAEIASTQKGGVRDAAIISAAQKIEHFEIASYGTLRSFANTLGLKKAEKLLQKTLDEKKDSDYSLTKIAESSINLEAVVEL